MSIESVPSIGQGADHFQNRSQDQLQEQFQDHLENQSIEEQELIALKLEKLRILEERERLVAGLPHLYSQKHYPWSRRFEESKAKRLICIAGNQAGKSVQGIKRMLRYIFEKDRWAERWPELTARGGKPTLFWAMYPSSDVATIEFQQKYEMLLPQGEFKDSEEYGWKANYSNGRINNVVFRNGVTLDFKSYSMDLNNIQSGTVSYVNLDEEPPFEAMPEILLRLEANNGYLNIVFTPTRAQQPWREIIEDRTNWVEDDVEIHKVTLYDCVEFEDGTPGIWSEEKIERLKKRLSTNAEIRKRIYGDFVLDEGLVYPTFERSRLVVKGHMLPSSWQYYAGIDWGGGGDETSKLSHPSAIVIVAVDPEFTRGRIVKLWRGDGMLTTAEDVVKKYIDLTSGLPPVSAAYFDYAAKDLGTYGSRLGLPFVPAEKSHLVGETTLNTLFKMGSLLVHDTAGDVEKLAREFESLLKGMSKNNAKDDLIDATRYACAKIPWNWAEISKALPVLDIPREKTYEEQEIEDRRGNMRSDDQDSIDLGIDEELAFWGDMLS